MSPTTHSHVRFGSLLCWWLLLAAAALAGQWLLHGQTVRLYAELLPRAGITIEGGLPQLLRAGEAPRTHMVPQRETVYDPPTVGVLHLDEQTCAAQFAALPLGAQDLAVLLHKLQGMGVGSIALSSPLVWQQQPGDMAREMFCRVMAGFEHSAVGLRGRTAAQADFTPLMLREAAIPAEQVEGDTSGLPAANSPLPNSLAEVPDALDLCWAPDWLQGEPLTQKPSGVENLSVPLLMRWNGETIPTLPFRLALAMRGLHPADVRVRAGQDISFGGRTLPLDEHGRVRLLAPQIRALSPAEVLGSSSASALSCLLLEQPAAGQEAPQRAERVAATLSMLAAAPREVLTQREEPLGLPILHELPALREPKTLVGAALGLFLLLLVLPLLPLWLRLPMLAALPALLLWQAWELLTQAVWLPLAPLLLLWLLLLPALAALRPVEKGLFGRRR